MFKMYHTRGHWQDVWAVNVACLGTGTVEQWDPVLPCAHTEAWEEKEESKLKSSWNQAESKAASAFTQHEPVLQDLCRLGMLLAQTIPEQENRDREPSKGWWRALALLFPGAGCVLLCHTGLRQRVLGSASPVWPKALEVHETVLTMFSC